MKKLFLLLVLASPALAQVPPLPVPAQRASVVGATNGKLVVPAYTLAKLKANGFSNRVTWKVFVPSESSNGVSSYVDTNGLNFIFVGPPGLYIVIASDANSYIQTNVTIQSPGNPPPPDKPPDNPNNPPGPKPPNIDPNTGFIYPPDSTNQNTSFSEKVAVSFPKTDQSKKDAKIFQILYDFVATKVWLDGQRANPGLKTVSQISALVKSEEDAVTVATPVKSLKNSYPETRAKIHDEFVSNLGKSDVLTPESRQAYVNFLREIAAGFARASVE